VCRPLSCPVGCQLSSAATHGPNGMSTIRWNDNQARAERGLALMLAPAVLLLAVPPAGRRGPGGTAWPACTAQPVAVAVNQVHWLHYWDSVTRM